MLVQETAPLDVMDEASFREAVRTFSGSRPSMVLIVDALPPVARAVHHLTPDVYPVVLECIDLRQAQSASRHLAADRAQRHPYPLLHLHALDPGARGCGASSGVASDGIPVLPTGRAIASLLIDAALLDIAFGAAITFDDAVDLTPIADDLRRLGFHCFWLD